MAVVANLDAILGAKTEQFVRGISGALVPVDQLQKELKAAGITQREWNAIVREGARVTANVRTPLEIHQQEIRDLNRLLQAGLISQQDYTRAIAQSQTALNNATGATARMNAQLQRAQQITTAVRTPLEIYQQEIRELNALLKAGAISQDTFNRSVARSDATLARNTQVASSFGGIATAIRGMVVAAAAFKALQFGRDLVQRSTGIQQALTESTAIVQDISAQQTDRLLQGAIDVAGDVRFSTEQAAEAYFFLFSAGLSVEQSLRNLPRVAQFAQAGNFDLAKATDLATDAQSALGLSVDDAAQNEKNLIDITNTLVGANTIANASVEQFSEALTNRAGAAMRSLNVELNEGVAVLAAFADQGIKGDAGGQQLSILLRDLTTKAINNKEAFEDLGINVFKDGDFQNIGQIIGEVEDALANLSDETQKATLLQLGFTDKSVGAIQALLGTSDKIAEYEESLNNMGDVVADVADAQFTSLSRASNELGAELDQLAVSLTPVIESFAPVIDDITGVVNVINDLIELLGNAADFWSDFWESANLGLDDETTAAIKLFTDLATNPLSTIGFTTDLLLGEDFAAQEAELAKPDPRVLAREEEAANLRREEEAFANAQAQAAKELQLEKEAADKIAKEEADRVAQLKLETAEKFEADLDAKAQRLIEAAKTPFEKATEEIEGLGVLRQTNRISDDVFAKSLARIINPRTEDVDTGPNGIDIGNAFDSDSEEAFRLIFGQERADPNTQLLERQNELSEMQIQRLDALAVAVTRPAIPTNLETIDF